MLYLKDKIDKRFAEREGFEPSDQFPGQHLSRMLHSTALPPLRMPYRTLLPISFQMLGIVRANNRKIPLQIINAVQPHIIS